MSRIHETISGRRIEYPEPSKALETFLRRIGDMVDDETVSEAQMIAVIYGRQNPIMDHGRIVDRGRVTRKVLADPVYKVLMDLLGRKRVAREKIDVAKVEARYSMGTTEVAERLGLARVSVQRLAETDRLQAWFKGGRLYFDPAAVQALSDAGGLGIRGAGRLTPLECVLDPMMVKTSSGVEYDSGRVVIQRWRRVAVRAADGMVLIIPGPVAAEIVDGACSIRGKFRIMRVMKGDAAAVAWENFGKRGRRVGAGRRGPATD